MLTGMIDSLKASLKLLQRDPDITAASSVDEGELAEELRKEKMEQKQAKLGQGPPNRGGPPQGYGG